MTATGGFAPAAAAPPSMGKGNGGFNGGALMGMGGRPMPQPMAPGARGPMVTGLQGGMPFDRSMWTHPVFHWVYPLF
jgi:hypothetical protein